MSEPKAKRITQNVVSILTIANESLTAKEISERYMKRFPGERDIHKRLNEVLSIMTGAGVLIQERKSSKYSILPISKRKMLLNKLKHLVLLKLLIERNRLIMNNNNENRTIKIPFIIFCIKNNSDAKIVYSVSHPKVIIKSRKNPLIATLSPFDIINSMKFTKSEIQVVLNSINVIRENPFLNDIITKEIQII